MAHENGSKIDEKNQPLNDASSKKQVNKKIGKSTQFQAGNTEYKNEQKW